MYSSPSSWSWSAAHSHGSNRKRSSSTGDVTSTVDSDIASLFLSPKFSDVTLKLVAASPSSSESRRARLQTGSEGGSQCEVWTVRAHSIILKLRSGYFETRFNFEAAATATTSNGEKVPEMLELQLVDGMTKASFMTMLEFLYTGRAPKPNADSLIDMLVMADFYQVASLRQYCLRAMKRRILRPSCMFDLLVKFHSTYPQMVDAKESKGVKFYTVQPKTIANVTLLQYPFHRNTSIRRPEPYENPKFLALPRDLLCEIIRRDSLKVDETMIFEAVLEWAMEQCKRQGIGTTGANLRQVLGEALYLVRFPLIDSKWFRRHVGESRGPELNRT